MDQTQSDKHLNFIVHSYTSASHLVPAPKTTIEAGRNTIGSATLSDGWSSVNWDFDVSIYNTCKKVFAYDRNPPIPPFRNLKEGHFPMNFLKEWGTPVNDTDDSIFLMEDLQEFQSTNLEYLLSFVGRHGAQPSQVGRSGIDLSLRPSNLSSVGDRAMLPRNNPEQRLAKRRRLDNGFLHDTIPNPHYRPSPPANYPPLDTLRLTAYTKSQPNPISPYDSFKIQDYLIRPYSRSAWIIPIRGILPWKGCTSAVMLDEVESMPPSSPGPITSPAQNDCYIAWSRTSVVSFWDFLLAIQQAKTLGPISISFHAASPHIPSLIRPTSEPDQDINRSTHSEDITSKSSANSVFRTSLQVVDHIKVYHDVTYAMYLRNVFDAWSYHFCPTHDVGSRVHDNGDATGMAEGENVEGGKRQIIPLITEAKKVRILKGAALVLVDESSNGVLLL